MSFLQFPITIGAIFRFLLIIFLFIYMVYTFINDKNRELLIILFSAHLLMGTTFMINFFMKEPFLFFEELQFLLKTSYFVSVFLFTLLLIEKNISFYKIGKRAIPYVAIIITSSFWISLITKTNLMSYQYDKAGYSGWFFSANELSLIILILLSLSLIYLHEAKGSEQNLYFFVIFLLLSISPMIGTKTVFFGSIIVLSLYTAYVLFFMQKQRFTLIYLVIICLYVVFIPFSPIMTNTQLTNEHTKVKQVEAMTTNETIMPPFIKKMLSSRDIYFQIQAEDFYYAPFIYQLFGLGYGGNYTKAAKLIEMDFFDLLFSYGYIGFFLIIIPLLLVIQQSFILKWTITSLLLQFTIFLLLIISALAGHMLFAPSVITYFVFLLLQTAEIHEINENMR